MTYSSWFYYLSKLQTEQVQVFHFPDSCSLFHFPHAFCELLSQIVALIDKNIHLFCEPEQILGLFGLQVVASSIQSPLPMVYRRIAYPSQPNTHFCCALNYLLVGKGCIPETWGSYQSLIVDFTTGEVMDSDQYLYQLACSGPSGKVYGWLGYHCLNKVWQKALKHEF